ncbi:hypothetical protein OG900_22050 [Streptomyces sp. NBC_00433]
MVQDLERMVVRHTLRIPAPPAGASVAGQGDTAVRQFDAALMSAGFTLSADARRRLAGLEPAAVTGAATRTLAAVKEMVGDHVQHNAYFVDFPANVPDTQEFWWSCIAEALADEAVRQRTVEQLSSGVVDLLTLPAYGRYQHSYEDMLAVHGELVAAAGDRVTVLHLGGALEDEVRALYLALAGSSTPLGGEGLRDLAVLAEHCVAGAQPERIPVRENRAEINRARLAANASLLLDTVTDVLRLACTLSGGDAGLVEPTRFLALRRPVRRALLAGLDAVVAADPAKLADVGAHREEFKRLGERLHPHEYPQWPGAASVFAVARGELRARSFDSRVEELLAAGDVVGAADVLAAAPGRLLRALDRLLRSCGTRQEREAVAAAAEQAAAGASGRVLLAVREHLLGRAGPPAREQSGTRVFVNRRGAGWVAPDTRGPVPEVERQRVADALDTEIARRLPRPARLLIDPAMLDVALPLSGRAAAGGFGTLPRGSVSPVEGDLLRFFVHWRQAKETTDFDLSAQLLDAGYRTAAWLSYTQLRQYEGEHSGDITEAPEGAAEFINLRLASVRSTFIVPQVHIYSGEGFEEVEESFFGFMLREREQQGRPFEPRTVRMKSELRGPGRVALPLAFQRGRDGTWQAKWLHLYLRGMPSGNRVEGHRVTVSSLLRSVVEREYLTVRWLTDLMTADPGTVSTLWDGGSLPTDPVTYIGMERPEGLHPDSVVITPRNLRALIPE